MLHILGKSWWKGRRCLKAAAYDQWLEGHVNSLDIYLEVIYSFSVILVLSDEDNIMFFCGPGYLIYYFIIHI